MLPNWLFKVLVVANHHTVKSSQSNTWTQRKTAKDLGISLRNVNLCVRIKKAWTKNPKIFAGLTSKKAAIKILKEWEEDA